MGESVLINSELRRLKRRITGSARSISAQRSYQVNPLAHTARPKLTQEKPLVSLNLCAQRALGRLPTGQLTWGCTADWARPLVSHSDEPSRFNGL